MPQQPTQTIPNKATDPIRLLQIAAYVCIVAWGMREASNLLSLVMISLLLAYAILPFPNWLVRRFHLRKHSTLLLTAGFLIALYLVVGAAFVEAALHIRVRMPVYQTHLQEIFEQLTTLLNSHGFQSAGLGTVGLSDSHRVISLLEIAIPKVMGVISDRVIVAVLSILFLIEIMDSDTDTESALAHKLRYYGEDVLQFIAISAKTGAITAVANLLLLIVLRVDFPVLWCVLFFFLHFIPNIGFLLALVPPAVIALLTFGWQRALLVIAGMVLTEMLSDYLLTPMLMKRSLEVSFLETALSMLVWAFLLGPAGAVVAIPLTMALKRYLNDFFTEHRAAAELALD